MEQAGNTVSTGDGALKFFEGIGSGAVAYIRSELDGYVEMGSSVGGWVADGSKCTWSGIKSLFWRDEIVDQEACKSLNKIGDSLQDAYFTTKRLVALSKAELLELLESLVKTVMEVFNDVLKAILNWAAEQKERIKTWLEETARDAKKLGSLAGSLITALILEYVTAGAGRALKAAKTVSKLPDVPGVQAVSAGVLPAPVYSSFAAAPAGAPIALVAVYGARADLDLLDDLFQVFQSTLNRNRVRFSRNMTLRKLGVIRESMSEKTAETLAAFAKRRKELDALLAGHFKVLRNRIGSHSSNVEKAKEFNRRWLTFIYADTLVDNADADPFDLLSRKDSIIAQLFESNHIIEQRVFNAATGRLKADFLKLGWKSPDDMAAILLPSSQHTASIKRMLDRYAELGMELDADDLKALTVRTDNLTEMLKAAVTLPIDPNTPLVELLGRYREVYKTFDGGILWNNAMEQSFTDWTVKLGGTP